jgi:hypothetical protein
MALYSANNPTRTVTLHKPTCPHARSAPQGGCGCGLTSTRGNQQWWCEEHVTLKAVGDFMNARFWAILACDNCFGGGGR